MSAPQASRTWLCWFVAIWLGLAASAAPARAGKKSEKASEGADISHRRQFGASLHLGTGLRAISPYEGEYCGTGESVCVARTPVALDLGLSYGVLDSLELLLELRLGLERDFGASDNLDGPRIIAFSPGFRYYFSEAKSLKVFSSFQFSIDATDYAQAGGTDFAVKNTNGLLYDLDKRVGLYGFFGEIIGWDRWLRIEIEAGLGVQARFP